MKKLYTTILVLFMLSCSDDYMTIEQRIIDSDAKVPLYFYASAEQAGMNTWRPCIYGRQFKCCSLVRSSSYYNRRGQEGLGSVYN